MLAIPSGTKGLTEVTASVCVCVFYSIGESVHSPIIILTVVYIYINTEWLKRTLHR